MLKRETNIESSFIRWVKDNYYVQIVKFQDPNGPDRLILCPNGMVYFIEFKRKGQKLRPAQIEYFNRLNNLGFTVDWADNLEDAKDKFSWFMNNVVYSTSFAVTVTTLVNTLVNTVGVTGKDVFALITVLIKAAIASEAKPLVTET